MLNSEITKLIYSIIAIILFLVAGVTLISGLKKKNSKLMAVGLILCGAVVVLYKFLIEPTAEPFGMGFGILLSRGFGGLFGGGKRKSDAELEEIRRKFVESRIRRASK